MHAISCGQVYFGLEEALLSMPFQAVLEFPACFWLLQFYALHWTSIILKWSFWHRQIAKTAACCSFGKAESAATLHLLQDQVHLRSRAPTAITMVTMSPWSPCQAGLTQGLPKLRSIGLQELGIHLVESSPRSFEKNPLPMNLCKISRVPRRQLASISYKPARLPTSK